VGWDEFRARLRPGRSSGGWHSIKAKDAVYFPTPWSVAYCTAPTRALACRYALESAMDELAYVLDVDPLE
jgi:hypothetical protein